MELSEKNICKMVEQMDYHLRTDLLKKDGKLQEDKLWENTYIKHQIAKREKGGKFDLEDHIRAMVYSMLSANISWDRIAKGIDPETKRIIPIDEIFCNYDSKQLLKCTSEQLLDAITGLHCGGPATAIQMSELLSKNIPKLLAIQEKNETIDDYYQKFIDNDNSLKTLITILSASNSENKLAQMDIALVCEYLRNVGHNIPKPDRHLCRILGSDYLALSDKPVVPEFEAFDIVIKLAELMEKPVAEVDYILWSYCAKGFGEVCTKKNAKCEKCVAREYCRKKKGGNAS